ncbi:MAG TPA: hypothetical protein VKQ06_08245 [Gammaproteobacteria bacterium]|nr:hypothetical protein [Gammaproteobacteria bacterium]
MRALFFVLVLANLGFAAWATWYRAPEVPTRPMVANAPGIEIYADVAAQETPASGAARGGDARESTQTFVRCMSIGPLPNRVDVDDTVRALTGSGFEARQRVAQGEVWLGQWVYIDAIASQSEAARIVDVLAENDITEAYVIADGNNGSIVSLGVFSQQERARQRFSDAEALGFSPVVADRSQPGEVFWLDVTARDGAEFPLSDLESLNIDPQLRLESCAASDRSSQQ